jgi:hypothetical protein
MVVIPNPFPRHSMPAAPTAATAHTLRRPLPIAIDGARGVAGTAVLTSRISTGTLEGVDEEHGIYRAEVFAIMGALADVMVDVRTILAYFEGDDDDEAEEEDLPDA